MTGPMRQRLSELLAGIVTIDAAQDRTVAALAQDSRMPMAEGLFLACAGAQHHGLAFAPQAVANGAVAVLYETPLPPGVEAESLAAAADVPLIPCARLAQQAGVIAARFYRQPSTCMTVVGVTGTNGKTSCSHYLARAMQHCQGPAGLIGTLGSGLYGRLQASGYTTPDAVTLQATFAELYDQGAALVAMEVSSHALQQGRVNGTRFSGAIFTNLSHEHLDYHGDLDRYGAVKQRLFEWPGLRFAVINADDDFGRRLAHGLPREVQRIRYSLAGREAELRGRLLSRDRSGMVIAVDSPWGSGELRTALLGEFNAANLLAALAALVLCGVGFAQALRCLATAEAVPGRMEHFGGLGALPLVVVDYAHTPDALAKVLQTLRSHCAGLLWCVFGCGGDRDRSKRPLMGAIAGEQADRVVLTDDNPRGEDGERIIADIRAGIDAAAAPQVTVLRDRAAAIAYAISHAAANDVVLVAGKGHEDYQLVGGQRFEFSDRETVRRVLQEVA